MIFSIVIPVYNVAPYLRECLDSVLAQTCSDWEAICIDDGSTDGSAEILDSYAEKDARFTVVHQENAGVSTARNRGIDKATGDYVLFVDPDDTLDSGILKDVGDFIQRNPCDVAVFDCVTLKGSGRRRYSFAECDIPVIDQVVRDEMLRYLIRMDRPHLLEIAGPWCKAYKRTVFKKHRFEPALKISEDRVFNFSVYDDETLTLAYLHAPGYYYRIRDDSCAREYRSDLLECRMASFRKFAQLAKGRYSELIGIEMWEWTWWSWASVLGAGTRAPLWRKYTNFIHRVFEPESRALFAKVAGEENATLPMKCELFCLRHGISFPWWCRALVGLSKDLLRRSSFIMASWRWLKERGEGL